MKYTVEFGSTTGKAKSENQDTYLIDREFAFDDSCEGRDFRKKFSKRGLFLIGDGIGGESGGKHASAILQGAFRRYLEENRIGRKGNTQLEFDCLIDSVSREITLALADQPGNGGTTATFAYIDDGNCLIGNIGDSPAFLFNMEDENIIQLYKEDSIAGRELERGNISYREYLESPYKHTITDFIGKGDKPVKDTHYLNFQLQKNDIILLCSDGLTDMVSLSDIRSVLLEKSKDNKAGRLMHMAEEAGGRDNITVIVIKVLSD